MGKKKLRLDAEPGLAASLDSAGTSLVEGVVVVGGLVLAGALLAIVSGVPETTYGPWIWASLGLKGVGFTLAVLLFVIAALVRRVVKLWRRFA